MRMADSVIWFRCTRNGKRMWGIRTNAGHFFITKRTKAEVITHLWMQNRDVWNPIYNRWDIEIMLVDEEALETIAE